MPIEVRNLVKSFGDPPVQVIKGLNFKIADGELITITGKSGSGKSTLLYMLSSLDPSTSGNIVIDGQDISTLNEKKVHEFRNRNMGFVFQFHYLLPELTALENILMPARKLGLEKEKAAYAKDLMKEFDLVGKEDRFPSQLSGGEQQRVAIARALIMKPKYLFADEPTGNLDAANGMAVMSHFKKLNKEKGTTIIYVTHDSDFAALAQRRIHIVDGFFVDQ